MIRETRAALYCWFSKSSVLFWGTEVFVLHIFDRFQCESESTFPPFHEFPLGGRKYKGSGISIENSEVKVDEKAMSALVHFTIHSNRLSKFFYSLSSTINMNGASKENQWFLNKYLFQPLSTYFSTLQKKVHIIII